jgi:chromosome segregation ATPase
MRFNSLVKAVALSAAGILLTLPALTRAQDPQTSDPVADAARRSRQAKQNAAKPHKVYTDDDVSRPKAAPAPAADANAANAAGQATTPDPTAKPATPANADANNEATWRKRFQQQRDNIARAEKELDILQRETQKAQVQYYPDPQKALSEQYTRKDILDKEAKVDAKRQEITQLKQGLSDLEDELRKAGGDPGWSR